MHTPGPWVLFHEGTTIAVLDGKGQEAKNEVVSWLGFDRSDTPRKRHLANARLIAAAPDLSGALKRIVDLNEQLPTDHPSRLSHGEYQQALAALAKAGIRP